jgi:hypothetical protein
MLFFMGHSEASLVSFRRPESVQRGCDALRIASARGFGTASARESAREPRAPSVAVEHSWYRQRSPCNVGRVRGLLLRTCGPLVATLLTTTVVASAEPESGRVAARLSYAVNEPGCPDETSFRHLVTARLGYDPFDATATIRVSVEITKQRGRLHGHAEVVRGEGAPGNRDLTGELDRCEPLTTAIATTVAIALDPGQSAATPEPPIALPTPQPPPATLVVVRERDAAPTPPSAPAPRPEAEHVSLFGIAGGVASAALGPAPTFGPEIGFMLRTGALSLEGSARVETTFGDVRAAGGDRLEATIFSGAIVPCAHLAAVAGCLFGRVGAFQGRAPDVADPTLRTAAFAAVGLRGAYTLRISSSFGVRGALETGLPLVRTSLGIEGKDVWTAPPVFAGASLALLAKFL